MRNINAFHLHIVHATRVKPRPKLIHIKGLKQKLKMFVLCITKEK